MTDIRTLLDEVPGWKGRVAVVTPLESGITHHNFQVEIDGGSWVLRSPGPHSDLLGIRREHEYACAQIAADLGVGPEVLHASPEHGLLVVRFQPGRTLTAETARKPPILARIVASLRQVHDGPEFPGSFCPFDAVRSYHELACEKGIEFPESLPAGLAVGERIETALQDTDTRRVPCHNDLVAANLVDDCERVYLLDWEYGGMGDPFFDLGGFAANQELDDEGIDLLLETYLDGTVQPADHARIRLMMLVSDLRGSLWGYLQSGLPGLGPDYARYGAKHFARYVERSESGELEGWLEQLTAS